MKLQLRKGLILFTCLVLLLAPAALLASDVDVAVVDVTAPTGSVTLQPGGSGPITINLSVTGNQVGTATFEVYRDWTLSGGTFTGSNPQEFTVNPRAGGDPATTFSTSGTVTVAAGQADGTFTLAVGVFDITNTNTSGGKLAVGDPSNYQVTVSAPTPPSDTTPPTISIIPAPDGNAGWYKTSPAVVSITANDDVGIQSITCIPGGTVYSGPVAPSVTASLNIANQGLTSVSCTATDSSGKSTTDTKTISLDSEAATGVSGAATLPANGNNGWYKSAVDVVFTGTDVTSGIANCSTVTYSGPDNAAATVLGSCTETAGNTSADVASFPFQYDATAPTINWSSELPADGASYPVDSVPLEPDCEAVDGLSGAGTCTVTGYGDTCGIHTLTATVYDTAGNSGTEQRTYSVTYKFSGFYQPVDMFDVYNAVKSGSTVPLKFEVFSGSTPADEVTSTTGMIMSVDNVTCDDGALIDDIEYLTSGSTSLRYDSVAGQFIFNWKTPAKMAGKCYAVTAAAGGGSIKAYFRLK